MSNFDSKIIGGALWEDIHRKKYKLTTIERAEAIQKYMELNNKTPSQVAEEMNVTKKEIYRTLGILKAPQNVLRMMENGVITGDKVSRIIYNLKDKSDESINKAVEEVIERNLNSIGIEKLIAEKNNNNKIAEHYRGIIRLLHLEISKIENQLDVLDKKSLIMIGIDTNTLIDNLEKLDNVINQKKKELNKVKIKKQPLPEDKHD